MTDKELIAALEADGKKLRELTGAEHGPDFMEDTDDPPEWCRFRIDANGGLRCANRPAEACARCPVGREFSQDDILP